MIWSPQQVGAIDAVGRWLKAANEPIFRLFGYAGVGKTTLATHLASLVNGRVYFAAYSGKAASVLRSKGCFNASTIHSLIYIPSDKSKETLQKLKEELAETIHEIKSEPEYRTMDPPNVDEEAEVIKLRKKIADEEKRLKKPTFVLNPDSELKGASLLVLDEVSMVGSYMADDLLSFGVPILALGDPAQLPPIKGCGYFVNTKPDTMLTEIHRQAKGNPIIEMATRVRQGKDLAVGHYGTSTVMEGKPPKELVLGADQVLVGRHITRRSVINKTRRLLGRGNDPLPVTGDKLVCLRNDHEVGLLNGTIWKVAESEVIPNMNVMSLSVDSEDGDSVTVDAHTQYFKGEEPAFYEIKAAQCFDYGYALTTHKAQGSQWPNVFVFDESHCFRNARKKWLYTAITRAAETVTICKRW
jgi:exodeoxyribonuclease-5